MNGRRRIWVLGLTAAAAVLLAAMAAGRWAALSRADEQPAAEESAPKPQSPADPSKRIREIPFADVYYTYNSIRPSPPEMKRARLPEDFRATCQHLGASNIFLVRGDDINQAVLATRLAVLSGFGVDAPLKPKLHDSRTLWLAVFLGVGGSSPPEWIVKSITHEDMRLRFVYEVGFAETLDLCPYLFLARLGELEAGEYALELYDDRYKEPRLVRRVRIP
jgi:hypothetical protein